jgi:hypothetical protein
VRAFVASVATNNPANGEETAKIFCRAEPPYRVPAGEDSPANGTSATDSQLMSGS